MKETGRVLSTRGARAEVEVAARGECEGCSAHAMCNWTGTTTRKVLAVNQAGASVGSLVTLEMPEAGGMKSNLLVFGIPVLTMLVGVLVGGLVIRKDLWSGILAGVGLAVGIGIVKVIDISVSRSGRTLPVITALADESAVRKECTSQNGGAANESVGDSDTGRGPGDGVR
jgi:sigma-E factor negative regulatory protein RseC